MLPPGSLVLKLTESVFIDGFSEISRKLKLLQRLGIPLSLDDFGTLGRAVRVHSRIVELIKRSTAFLFDVKSVSIPELPADAVVTKFVDEVLAERQKTAPVGEIRASATTTSN